MTWGNLLFALAKVAPHGIKMKLSRVSSSFVDHLIKTDQAGISGKHHNEMRWWLGNFHLDLWHQPSVYRLMMASLVLKENNLKPP